MPLLRPVSTEPIAIRRALEEGWQGFCRHTWVLVSLTLMLGGLNLLCWLVYRHSRAIARMAWSVLVLLLLLALVRQSGELSSWMLTLLLPRLGALPLWAAGAVVTYVLADQVLLLPITVLGNQAGLSAFRSGRLATDRHWLHALGLLLVVSLVLLGGFLLLVGLAVALPLALCTLTAAYRQLFVLTMASGQQLHRR